MGYGMLTDWYRSELGPQCMVNSASGCVRLSRCSVLFNSCPSCVFISQQFKRCLPLTRNLLCVSFMSVLPSFSDWIRQQAEFYLRFLSSVTRAMHTSSILRTTRACCCSVNLLESITFLADFMTSDLETIAKSIALADAFSRHLHENRCQ